MIHTDRRNVFLFTSLLVTAALTAGCSRQKPELPGSESGAASETAAAEHSASPELEADERKIDQSVYTARESRTHTIKSDLPILVGFRTNFSHDMTSTIQAHKNVFGRDISVAAELSAGEPVTYAGSNHGGAVQAIPTNGIIEVEIQNYCRGPLEILLYTKALTNEELEPFKSDGAF